MQSPNTLPVDWFARPADELAPLLIGLRLATRIDGRLTTGRIVETEAYLPTRDPACHAARGRTPSNASMFAAAGIAYVYPIHSRVCFNVVCGEAGEGAAVLIRALQPLEGMAEMIRRRGSTGTLRDLCRGPARLCEALGIERAHDGLPLTAGSPLWIDRFDARVEAGPVRRTRRIGVTSAQSRQLRWVLDSPWASRPASGR